MKRIESMATRARSRRFVLGALIAGVACRTPLASASPDRMVPTSSVGSGDLEARDTSWVVMSDTARYIHTAVTLTNVGRSPVRVEFGRCAVQLLAYTMPDRSGAPVWDSERRGFYVCLSDAVEYTIVPGASLAPREFTFGSPLIDILGDSLPDGHYWFTARLRVSNHEFVGIPAGDFDLAVPRPPMPATREDYLMVYQATPVEVTGSPAAVHAQATATLKYAGGARVWLSRDCPLLIYAYRDRVRRDTAPRSGPPDWAQPACGTAQQQVDMHRGDTRILRSVVPVRDILGTPLRPGHYYFAIVVQMRTKPGFLSAAEADLTQ